MPSPPPTLYAGLFTGGVPDDAGAGGAIECSAGNYSRLAISTGASGTGVGAYFSGPSSTDGTLTGTTDLDFPMCTGADWGLVTGWALFDALSSGNMLVRGEVSPAANVIVGYIFQFKAPNWLIRFD